MYALAQQTLKYQRSWIGKTRAPCREEKNMCELDQTIWSLTYDLETPRRALRERLTEDLESC